jgi:hypothetical protein
MADKCVLKNRKKKKFDKIGIKCEDETHTEEEEEEEERTESPSL